MFLIIKITHHHFRKLEYFIKTNIKGIQNSTQQHNYLHMICTIPDTLFCVYLHR